MPNREMGREMGGNSGDDADKPQDINVQQIGTDPQTRKVRQDQERTSHM